MRNEENLLGLQVGDEVEIIQLGAFSNHLSVGDTLRFLGIEDSDWYNFSVLTCSQDSRFVGLNQIGTASWLVRCIRKLPVLREVPHDTTTPLKVGDYVEVIYERSCELGCIKKVVEISDSGHIRTVSQVGPSSGKIVRYTKREYLSLIK